MIESTSQLQPLRQADLVVIQTSAGNIFRRTVAVFNLLAGVFVGGAMLYSGFQHVGNPYSFLSAVFQYQMVSPWLGLAIAVTLPGAQIAIGICLVGRAWVRPASLAACALLFVFVAAQCLALGRGLEIPCGCFGTSKYEPVDLWTVARTIGLFGLAGLAFAGSGVTSCKERGA